MKNLKSTEPTDLDEHGWYSDIYKGKKSGRDNDICTVWGKSKEELEQRVIMICKSGEMIEALTKAEKILLEVHQYGLIGGLSDDDIHTVEDIQLLIKEIS